MISVFLGAFLLTQATDPHAGHSTPVLAAQEAKSEKKICKVDPNYTGTRMRKKLCLTGTQWAIKAQGKSAGELKTIGAR